MLNRRPAKMILQGVVSAGLLYWVFQGLDWHALGAMLTAMNPFWFMLGIGFYWLNLVCSAWRSRYVMQRLGRPMPYSLLLRLTGIGAFFNQVLPGAVSGDAVRAYLSRPYTQSLALAMAAVLGERLIGLGVLIAVALLAFGLGSLWLDVLPPVGILLGGVALAYLVGMAVLLWSGLPLPRGRMGEKLRELHHALHCLVQANSLLTPMLLLSLLVQLISIALFAVLGKALHVQLDPAAIWIIWPLVSLLSILPIALGGWGLREGLMVYFLAFVGVPDEQALALSLLAGFVVLLASLPGGLVWLSFDRHEAVSGILSGKV